jgi:diaminohydroxyphosphoribosylaminopyrimidine deaminase/5-amino-6-(5-phosphoribosylamino)uracil reductase
MRRALGLARRGLGRVAPNPAVGCVLVRPDLGFHPHGHIVGAGWTQPGGRPHAETEAIKQAGDLSAGAHAYVTLEPCNHQGETGPCTDALIGAGIAAVTIAVEDPDPRVSGAGIKRLADAGIAVRTGLLGDVAAQLNAGFLSVVQRGRPWVTMKAATTLDGAIASRSGKSQWITGPEARARGHLLRAENDVIVTGIGTVREDDPELTCRLPGLSVRSPIRVVVDPRLEIGLAAKLFDTLETAPLWLLASESADPERASLMRGAGAVVIDLPPVPGGRISPEMILNALAERGITRVLLEAGSALSASFMDAGMIDELAWFRAATVMGGDGLPAIAPMAVNSPENAPKFRLVSTIDLDGDVLERYLRLGNED